MPQIQLSDHFTYARLFRFTLPSIIMMIFTSLYTIVDGLFVSNFVGKMQFASLNIIFPFIIILGSLGFMFGTGGSALVALTLGLKEKEKANRYFTQMFIVVAVIGIISSVLGIIFTKPIAVFLGANETMLKSAVPYARVMFAFIPIFMLQNLFQSFLVVAEKPNIGLYATVFSGFTNMALDALFIIVFKWGIAGAALATGIGQLLGAFIPAFYFLTAKDSVLKFTKTKVEFSPIFKAATNGLSEFVGNVSGAIVGVVFNLKLMAYAGANGVATYGILMYVQFVFMAIFIGYAIGTSPIISYNYGASNASELKNIFSKSMKLLIVIGIVMTTLALATRNILAHIFVGYDEELMQMTQKAFLITSFAFLLQGLNIFASSLFTALNDGTTSAIISLLRTFGLQLLCIFILPLLWGLNGIWLAMVLAELISTFVSFYFIAKKKEKYHYA